MGGEGQDEVAKESSQGESNAAGRAGGQPGRATAALRQGDARRLCSPPSPSHPPAMPDGPGCARAGQGQQRASARHAGARRCSLGGGARQQRGRPAGTKTSSSGEGRRRGVRCALLSPPALAGFLVLLAPVSGVSPPGARQRPLAGWPGPAHHTHGESTESRAAGWPLQSRTHGGGQADLSGTARGGRGQGEEGEANSKAASEFSNARRRGRAEAASRQGGFGRRRALVRPPLRCCCLARFQGGPFCSSMGPSLLALMLARTGWRRPPTLFSWIRRALLFDPQQSITAPVKDRHRWRVSIAFSSCQDE